MNESKTVTRLASCPYLLSSPINYTLTYLADPSAQVSHDARNRYLADDPLPPRWVGEKVEAAFEATPDGYLRLADTVLDKR